jgi:hypothetical protein
MGKERSLLVRWDKTASGGRRHTNAVAGHRRSIVLGKVAV